MSEDQKTISPVVIGLGIVLLLAAFFAWRHMTALERQMARLDEQVASLDQQARSAEDRALRAEQRAEEAEESAGAAAEQAKLASQRERESSEQARQARLAEQVAREKETLAAMERDVALAEAGQSAAARAAAERDLTEKRREHQKTLEQLDQARLETMRAQTETRRLQAKMNRELERLQGALGRIAETKRTALGLVMTLDSDQIEFDFNQATLRPQNREVLSKIAGVLLTFNDYGVEIFGHTDDVGGEEYNKQLSKKRAETVKSYLVEAGIRPEVLSTLGMGKSSPRVEGTDPEARQRNRRVELAIVFSEGEYEELAEQRTEALETADPSTP